MTDISVLLPSRGRPATLEFAVASLMAGGDAGVEVIVGLDDDDPQLGEATSLILDLANDYPGVRLSVNPRQPSVGALFNLMYRESKGNWFIPFPDDYTMTTKDWAERLRHAVGLMPKGLGVAYLADQLYPGFSTFPVVSRKTIELNGFFMPDFFPFLFGDTWWNEVGNMCGVKQPIDAHVQINLVQGNEHRLRDMVFWASIFEITRAMRMETAIKILREIYEGYEDESAYLVSTVPNRADSCTAMQAHMFEHRFLEKWDNTDPNPPSERYMNLKRAAESLLEQFPLKQQQERASAAGIAEAVV